ncbi:MAG: hypothetical protein LBE55_00945, partial [Clostridiales bacterium]|nr:hypothetical protein [Clostridiales bacterium]
MIQKKRLKSVQKGILAGLLAIVMLLAVPFAPALYANDPRDGLIGVWRGTYINNHGLNGCEFLIFRDGPNFRAVVHFFPVEGSPAGQASGSTLNDITFDPATGLFEIIPILYLDMPAGWSASGQTMGLYGDTIMGHIRGSEQFWVSASRVSVTDFPTTINHEHINAGGMCAFCLAPMAAALPIAPLAAANQTQAAIAAGFASSYAITGEGMLWTWGANDRGQLGQGNFGGHRNHPLHIRTNIVAVAAGSAHVLAIDNTGGLWAWGANDRGQVGDGTFFDRNAPVRIMDNVTHVAAGSYHSVAITANGNVWTWGANGRGQLGNGTTSDFNFPIMVMSGASAISAGLAHTLAIANNALHAWGWNDFGQLGDGTFSERHTPTLIMANVAHVAAGSYHTLTITDDGWLHAWGLNEQGRLGDGTTTNRNLPTRIMPNASAISAGTGHSLALTQDNMLWSWGLNWHGQIGDGTVTDRNTPAAMMSNITAISAGGHHSMAVAADGGLWTWGGNADGQIGDGSTTTRRIPVSIMGGIMPQAGAADLAPVPHIAPVTQDDAEIEFDLAAPGEYIYTLTPAGRLFAPSPAAIASVTDPMTAGGAIRATAQNLTEEQRDSGDAMNLAALHIENLMRRGSTRGLPMDGNIHAAILEDIRDVARDIQDETSAVLDDENLLFMRRMRTNL